MHHKKKYNEKARVTQWGKEHIPHTSYLIPPTSYLRYVHTYTYYTYTTHHAIPYLTLPKVPIQKHKTPHDSAFVIFGRNNHITHTNSLGAISIQATLPTYLPTYLPTLSAKGARGESSIKSFYKSGRNQSHSQLSLASTINRPAPVESGSPIYPYVDTLDRHFPLNLPTYCCLAALYFFCPNRL